MLDVDDVIGWTICTGGMATGTIGCCIGDTTAATGLFGNEGGWGFGGGGPVVGTNPAPILIFFFFKLKLKFIIYSISTEIKAIFHSIKFVLKITII